MAKKEFFQASMKARVSLKKASLAKEVNSVALEESS